MGEQDPRYWRSRAEEARAVANQFYKEGRRIMLGIADGYEQMAEAAARIQRSQETLLRTQQKKVC
jgi:hypothetical protein